jgi:lipopolysaccharide cholinephosphotransferase
MEGGTLMGAVKYQGFVPWDDDIDVVMVRDEYEKFLKLAPSELDEKFFLQSYNNVPDFPLNYAKLCLNGTENYDYDYAHIETMHHGIFMDIFPIDNVIPEKLDRHCSLVGVFTGARKTKLKTIKPRGIRKFIYGTLSLLPMKTLIKIIDKACNRYNKKNTQYIYEVCNPNRNFKPLKSDMYASLTELMFRDKSFLAVSNYDEFLKFRFGENYMNELPSEDKRKPSHNQNIRMLSNEIGNKEIIFE